MGVNLNDIRGVVHAWQYLHFHQISHRCTWSFANSSFQDLNGSYITMDYYYNSTQNNDIFALHVEPYFHYASRKTLCYFRLNDCRKTAGNVNQPPYPYTAAIH